MYSRRSRRSYRRPYRRRRLYRRPYRRRYNNRYPGRSVQRPINGMPPVFKTKLCFERLVNLAPAATFYTAYAYLNSAFDPAGSITNGQAAFFDEIAAIYDKYCVTYARYQLLFQTDNALDGGVVTMYKSLDSTQPANLTQAIEQPNSKRVTFGTEASRSACKLNGKASVKRWVLNSMEANDSFSSAVTTNPTSLLYLHVSFASMNSGGAPSNLSGNLIIKMTQWVTFFQRANITDT